MTLAEWLKHHKMPVDEFAALLRCRRQHVYRYLSGERTPSKVRLRHIFDLTAGEVAPNDWFLDRRRRKRAAEVLLAYAGLKTSTRRQAAGSGAPPPTRLARAA